jgi:hypothetical protein
MKSNVIITASDRRYGDFLIEHWLRSLRDNTDLSDIDVAVLDYGLSVAQRFYLESNGVFVHPGKRDGHVTVIRYRELRSFLVAHPEYAQAALCDSGDIIFQGDIAPVFEKDRFSFRAVCEDYKPFFSFFISSDFFDSGDRERLSECFVRNPMINGGFVVGPREKMIMLADECLVVIKDKTRFGPDQIVLNDVLYRDRFVSLDPLYNYVIATAKEGVKIEGGAILTGEYREPVVVHNAGNVGALRPIEDFGYGPSRNRLKEDVYVALRALYASSEGLFKTQELFLDSRRLFRSQLRKLLRDLGLARQRRRAR